jgi:hypothetical protein
VSLKLPRDPASPREEVPLSAYSRQVHGYHGCSHAVADRILRGESFVPSTNLWDWLGAGIYFWEYGPDRALRWAEQSRSVRKPAVVGAIIQLGLCFDLLDTYFTAQLRDFYERWVSLLQMRGDQLPHNRGKGRYLDRAVIDEMMRYAEEMGIVYDSVRAAFVEGEPVYPGSALYTETHIQIAVRNARCIIGVFRPATTSLKEG